MSSDSLLGKKGKACKDDSPAATTEGVISDSFSTLTPEKKRDAAISALKRGDTSTLACMCIQKGGLSFLGDTGRKTADGDFLRSEIWNLLLKTDSFERVGPARDEGSLRSMEQIRCECEMDIVRSLHSFSCCRKLSGQNREVERKKLSDLVTWVLAQNQSLYYYQGFDDVCSVFAHVFKGRRIEVLNEVMKKMSTQVLADHHRKNFDTTMQLMDLIMVLLKKFDPNIYALILRTNVGTVFALPWVITGFAHSVSDIRVTKQIYDAILATHPLLCIYLSVAMLMRPHTRKNLFALAEKDDSMASIHHFLQTIAKPCVISSKPQDKNERRLSMKATKASAEKTNPANDEIYHDDDRIPESVEEEKENNVDLLVENAISMMCLYPPELVCMEYEKEKRKRYRARNVQSESPGIPTHSVACVPLGQKAHWIAVMDHIKGTSQVYEEMNNREKAASRKLQLMVLGFGMTTLVSITLASRWYAFLSQN